MRVAKRIIIYLFITFLLCNLPPFSGILTAMFVDMKGSSFGFVTKDLHFCMFGGIERVDSSKAYKDYVIRYADNDHDLYRFYNVKNYKMLWRYGEYLFDPNWQVPFLNVPSDFSTERYYGSYIDDQPSYKWNEITNQWVRR